MPLQARMSFSSESPTYREVLPHSEAAAEGVQVVAQNCVGWELLQLLCVSAAEHDRLRLQGLAELGHNFGYVLLPFLSPQSLQSAQPEVIFVGFAMLIGQMGEFHRLDNPIDDHRRSQTCSQAKEKHSTSAIAAQRLHGGVVDELDGLAECFAKIKSYPSLAQIVRLAQGLPVDDRARIAD